MLKLQQITDFLVQLNLVAAEQIDSWVENPQMIPSGEDSGAGGVLLYRQTYDAVISIERFPHQHHPVELLFAHISVWLMNNDSERDEIATPQTEVDVLDDSTADIEISISFEEELYGIEDPAGTIELFGTRYRLDSQLVNYAETGEVRT